jgi:hypothetical protein
MPELRFPKEITVTTQDGQERSYIISKFPTIAGREIVAKYPVSAMPKVGDYEVNKDVMLKLMAFVAVKTDNGELRLTTSTLVDNHVPDWETLAKIELEMIGYNCSFFQNGKASTFLENIKAESQKLISSTLTDSLERLLTAIK